MKFNWKYINYTLILLCCILLTYSISQYLKNYMQIQTIRSEIIKTKHDLEFQVSSCELIAAKKNREIINNSQIQLKSPSRAHWYFKIISEIDLLQQKLTILTSHNSMILDRYKIFLDKDTNEIYFGVEDYTLLDCEAYELVINSKNYPINHSNIYNIPNSDHLQVQYSKYYYNYKLNKIDTIELIRELN